MEKKPSPLPELWKEYELLIMKDIWKAISWRFKILYGVIFLLLFALLYLTWRQGSLVKPLQRETGSAKNTPAKPVPQAPSIKEIENFYHRTAQVQKDLQDQYEKKLSLLSQELQRLKKDSKRGQQKDLQRLEKTLAQLQQEIKKNKPVESKFKQIQQSYESSVLFIYTQINLLNPQTRKTRTINSFGTGFFVSSQGYIITNKHVVQPWKFGFMAEQIALLGYTVLEDTHLIAAWPSGVEVLNKFKELNFKKGFNNLYLHNLSLSNPSFDSLEKRVSAITPGHKISYNVHRNDDFDLVLLRAEGGPFKALPLIHSKHLEKLDPVMVLGYPRGTDIMEKGTIQTSPTLGTVRKIEDTIYVSASIIPGNSGGPLFSLQGGVVGICTRVYQKTETLGVCIKSRHIWELLPYSIRFQKQFEEFYKRDYK